MSYVLIFALQCLFPIFDLDADEFTGVSIVNTDTQTQQFTVTATPPDGSNAQSARFTLNPGTQRSALLREILGTTTGPSSGWIRIDSALNACTSYVTYGTDQTLMGTEAGQTAATASLTLPHVTVNTGFMELNHI